MRRIKYKCGNATYFVQPRRVTQLYGCYQHVARRCTALCRDLLIKMANVDPRLSLQLLDRERMIKRMIVAKSRMINGTYGRYEMKKI